MLMLRAAFGRYKERPSGGERPLEHLPLRKEGKCSILKGRLVSCALGEAGGEGVWPALGRAGKVASGEGGGARVRQGRVFG